MELAIIGLGRMGANMAKRLLRSSHHCVVFDQDGNKALSLKSEGAVPVSSLAELVPLLHPPRIVWVMLPSGTPTEETIQQLSKILEADDVVIDGGNSHFKDDVRRASELREKGIRYLDVGVSGGVWGLERGYSLMMGGDPSANDLLEPIFLSLAPGAQSVPPTANRRSDGSSLATDCGYFYCGPAGAGHFVKMVHNGIEYGMMQALAEGFDILCHADCDQLSPEHRYRFDLREIAEVWRRGSVVSSWLLDLIAVSLNRDPELSHFEGSVPDSGEGRWTIQAAIEESVPAPVISTSLYVRFRSREEQSFAERLLSAMRSEFGGHLEATRNTQKLGKKAG